MQSAFEAVATSSLVSALVTVGITAIRERRKRRVGARLSALHAINAIEDYVNSCMATLDVLDTAEYELSVINGDGPLEDRFMLVPAFPSFTTDVDWLALGVEASRGIKNYRSEANSRRASATLRWSPYLPDAFAKVKQYTAILAVNGIRLANELRADWKLKEFRSELISRIEADAIERHNAYVAERQTIHNRTTMSVQAPTDNERGRGEGGH